MVARAHLAVGLVGNLLVDLPALLLGTLLANRPLDEVGVWPETLGASYALEGARDPRLADPEALVLRHLRALGASGDLGGDSIEKFWLEFRL